MKTYFLGNGLKSGESTGHLIIDSFADKKFSSFSCLVAFASPSGVTGLSEAIQNSKEHIKEFNVFIGIDQKATSKEALEALLNLDIGTKIYYSKTPVIFHPKIYLFEGENSRIIIGSSNLTRRGLFHNIESSLVVEFEKSDNEGKEVLNQIHDYFESFFNSTSPNVHLLTTELINDLTESKIIPSEADSKKGKDDEELISEGLISKENFAKINFLFPSIQMQRIHEDFKPKKAIIKNEQRKQTIEVKEIQTDEPTGDGTVDWENKGELCWHKKLTQTDAQRTTKGKTNLVGGIRLSRSDWKDNGKFIEPQTYFRKKIFVDSEWTTGSKEPKEVADVMFKVRALGQDLGLHKLQIKYNPKGDSEQGNFTTAISIGSLSEFFKQYDLEDAEFSLFKPPIGKKEPFFIEIIKGKTISLDEFR